MAKPTPSEDAEVKEDVEAQPQTGLKPVKRAKVRKVVKKEAPAGQQDAAAEAAAKEVEEVSNPDGTKLGRSVWVEVAPEDGPLNEEEVKKAMRAISEVVDSEVLAPHRMQVTFPTSGSVRQALLLHNKTAAQLPRLSTGTDKKKRVFVTEKPDARVLVDIPLEPHLRVYVSRLPTGVDNRELQIMLSHYGKVAYIFRNPRMHYGFAAFTSKAAVDRAVSDEAVMIRDTLVSIARYEKKTERRKWQQAQLDEAVQYLNSLVPRNPYVAPSPSSIPVKPPKKKSAKKAKQPAGSPAADGEKPAPKAKAKGVKRRAVVEVEAPQTPLPEGVPRAVPEAAPKPKRRRKN